LFIERSRPDVDHLFSAVHQSRQALRLPPHGALVNLAEAVLLREDVRELAAGDVEQFQRAACLAAADADWDAVVQWSDDALDRQVGAQFFLADQQCRCGAAARLDLHLTVDAPR